jgi:hypothetical protein
MIKDATLDKVSKIELPQLRWKLIQI